MKRALLIIGCVLSFAAKAQVTDSIKKDLITAPDTVKHLKSKNWAFVPPAAMLTYGALSFAVHPIRNLDYTINNEITKTAPNFSSKAESYFQYAPVVIVYGLNLAGVSGKNTFVDRTALLGISAIMVGGTTTITKYATHRLRPNGSDHLSFFSGHTTTAFAGAEFLNQEYSERSAWYSVAGYTIATATGVFRLYNHDHWFSDVVAGAGAGILCTKAAYFIYPYLRNQLTHKGRGKKQMSFMPTYQDGNVGFSFAMQL